MGRSAALFSDGGDAVASSTRVKACGAVKVTDAFDIL